MGREGKWEGAEGGGRGHCSLHDTDSHKIFGPDLLLKVLMFNMHKMWSFDSQKNY